MYLKALEIQGFKSFPDKTKLSFEKNITAIVGPNGSGKSNLSDAISWVLGEQSSKTLRGTKMEDVIFGGTALRQPMGYAEVSLILDNSARIVDSDASEIQITRRYYRSGDSEYYINHEQVRLKDLNSLLMDTGLGRDGYSIIGQGRIADIISSKSTDRREVFDEAAGISRYRYRKEEAERRLEKTDENLLRVNDKIEELEMQVGPLKSQSEKAKKYLVLRDDLRVKEVSVWMETLDKLRAKAEDINLEYEQSSKALAKAKNDRESLYASSESLSERMHIKDVEVENARQRLSDKEGEQSACSSSIEVLKANVESVKDAMARAETEYAEQMTHLEEIRQNIADNEERITAIGREKTELSEKIKENENAVSGCKMKIQSRENTLATQTGQLDEVLSDERYVESRIAMLREMEKDYEGFSKAVKTVMKESSHGMLKGIHGPVANLVRADDECALAIETAMGGAAQNIVVDNRECGKSAIELLKRTDSGRGTFLPLDTIRGDILKELPQEEYGYVGLAYDLVDFDAKYDAIVASILGKTIVVESLNDAVRISKKHNDRYKLVTLDGQIINVGGSMTGGSTAKGTGFLTRANELDSLSKKLHSLKDKEESLNQDTDKIKNELSTLRYNLEMANEDRNELSSGMSSLTAEEGAVKNTISQFELLLGALTGDNDLRQKNIEKSKEEMERLSGEIEAKNLELGKIAEQVDAIKKEISDISDSRLELEGTRTRNEAETKEINATIDELQDRTIRIENKKTASELEEKQLLDKLWDSYELSFTTAESVRQPVENLPKSNKEIAELRREIGALGTPNLGAIEEYERVSERYEFLTSQRDDITSAKTDLLKIIRDVTKEMKDVFLTQFKIINEEFQKSFIDLFHGGKANLVLEDETDVLECGIEIHVQPPGKAVTSISLLSGGEKAFVAIALYFAILKVRPTPFCVMDEIEAALDEANVTRFAEYMRNISKRTQFLVITHRRGTMEEADMLYGVTMQEKGVSTVLELDLEQAKKTAES